MAQRPRVGYHAPGLMDLLPYTPERDIYRLLRVDPGAPTDEIVAACRRLARTFHPDHNESPRAHEEMQVVNAVRGLLTDPLARTEYDISRLRWLAATGGLPGARPPIIGRANARRPRRSFVSRQGLALLAGLRAALLALAPLRCARCRTAVDRGDTYCLACGHLLLTSSAFR